MFILIRALVWATLFIAFFLIAVPARVLGGAVGADAQIGLQQIAALMTTAAGALITIACIWAFVVVGRGTPAPFDPPRRLVARGPYAVIRNPMYVGAALAMSGAAMYYGSWALMGYVGLFLLVTHLFVLIYEEPTLRATFGDAYAAYCADVGRWLPKAAQRRAWFAIVVLSVSGAELAAQPPWRDPSPHQVRFIEVEPAVRLEMLDWGGSGRPLVFLGCYLTGHVFDDIGPKLTDRFHVYAFTRRGIGASSRPPAGYDLQRSVDDLLHVLDALTLQKPILAASSCGGKTLTFLAEQHPARLGGVVYLEGAEDPTLTLADYQLPPVDEANLPKRAEPPALDNSSVEAYRRTQKARSGVAFPEAEVRYSFAVKADGSLGEQLLSPTVRRAITSDARRKPEFGRIRVPVLAFFRTPPPFEQISRGYVIENDAQRQALRQQMEVERLMTARWASDVRAGVPSAKIVELPGASVFMFLSHEADVIREIRAFAGAVR
jgi:non-heme chloroperoxidase